MEIGERASRDELTPRRRLRAKFVSTIGIREYKDAGRDFLRFFIELAALTPDEVVLEVGSGCGRIASALTEYLSEKGRYEGFEIAASGVEWCRAAISSRFPTFHFLAADVYNRHYNPKGRYPAEAYRFPFPDASFDFVFLSSVFTHMLPEEVRQYLSEIARVLKPGGRCLITYFLWNAEAAALAAAGKSQFDFYCEQGVYRTENPAVPETAICFMEQFILELYAQTGLILKHPPWYGTWCGRPHTLSGQDVIVAWKH
ncbi:MAG: class I SAM-dependent methyltransferase [Lentisphaerae bacterium]|nr:class I SAM-dependent methyltransferase [Lentisphaerota bacterium]